MNLPNIIDKKLKICFSKFKLCIEKTSKIFFKRTLKNISILGSSCGSYQLDLITLLNCIVSIFHFAYSNHLSNWLEKMAQICEVKGDIKTWEKLDYKLQTKELFAIVKGLSNRGLNPKTQIISAHVTNVDIMEVFGQSNILKTANPNLDPNMNLKLLCLY